MDLFQTKPLDRILAESDSQNALKRSLGPGALVALGVGAVIGAGIFSLTGVAAATNSGPGLVFSFVIAAIGCSLAGLCYSEFATMIPVAGSAYTYAYASFGELWAWIIGWDLILEYAVGAATVAISWSQTLIALLDSLGVPFPRTIATSPFQGGMGRGLINLPAVAIVAAVSFILIRGIRESARVNNVIVVLKVMVILVFIAIGWSYIVPANHMPLIPPNEGEFGKFGWSGILAGAGIMFFAYIGFDAVSTAAQEARNPRRDLPIGIFGSLALCTALFMLYSWVLTGVVNYRSLNVAAPLALALDRIPYHWLNIAMNLAVLAGLTSVILVMLMGQSRVFYSMARDGLLPAAFAEVHPAYRTPWRSNLLLMVFVSLFSAFAPITVVGSMTSIGTMFAFVIVCGGVVVLRKRNPDMPRPFRTPWVPLVPTLGIIVNLLLMFGLGTSNWARLIGWLAIGLLIYFGRRRSRSTVVGCGSTEATP
ncbi:MAG TPA: amino acid permease [Candidatus Solibacter sp.]|nr:amino acid permease [Candidatus Solibacter sp.]